MKLNAARKRDDPVPAEAPISTLREKKQVEERVAIGANVVYEAIRREGHEELHRSVATLWWSALAAGLSMGFSFIAEGLLKAHLPASGWAPLVSKLGYSVGFLIVVLGRQQLFTENTLTAILPLLARKDLQMLGRVLRLWATVLAGNLAGTFLFAFCLAKIVLFDPRTQTALEEIGRAHFGSSLWTVVMKAIFAGWLIALMVWLLPGADSAKVSIIIVITYLIGLAEFSHVVAGSTTTLFLVANGSIRLETYLAHFLLPTLFGNIIGGVSLVAALGHAQVAGGKPEEAPARATRS